MQLLIDPEFEAFIPPLTPSEKAGLRAAIIATGGAHDPLLVWSSPDVTDAAIIIDGHNRYRICSELQLPYTIQRVEGLATREAVKDWMYDHQSGRRNLTVDQQVMLALSCGRTTAVGLTLHQKAVALIALGRSEVVQRIVAGESTIRAAHNAYIGAPPRAPRAAQPIPYALTTHTGERAVVSAPGSTPMGTLPPPPQPDSLVQVARLRESERTAKAQASALTEALREAQERNELFEALASAPLPPIGRRELSSGLREATAEVLISDLHVETLVRPSDTPMRNVYTMQVADLRLQRLFDGIEWQVQMQQHAFKIRDLVLWFGGDMITNHLHPENVETAQLGPTGALLWVEDRLVRGIRQMLASPCGFERIDVVCSSGNHGRTTKYMNATTSAEHSWEFVMYCNIARIFQDEPRVRVQAEKSTHTYHEIYDKHTHYHHGHEVKYGGGIGGIMIPMNKASSQWDKVKACHYHRYGHWHQYLAAGAITVNGSLIGYDSYAMSIKATPEQPQQAFTLYDSQRGVAMTAPLWVGDPEKEAAIWEATRHMYELGGPRLRGAA